MAPGGGGPGGGGGMPADMGGVPICGAMGAIAPGGGGPGGGGGIMPGIRGAIICWCAMPGAIAPGGGGPGGGGGIICCCGGYGCCGGYCCGGICWGHMALDGAPRGRCRRPPRAASGTSHGNIGASSPFKMAAMEAPSAKRVAICNAAQPFGAELVRYFCSNGYLVHGSVQTEQEKNDLSRWRGASFTVVDVADDAQVGAWLGAADELDLVVCLAAAAPAPAALWQSSPADFDATLRRNVSGVANVMRRVFGTKRARPITVVAVTTGAGRAVDGQRAAACASDWAVEGLVASVGASLQAPLAAVALQSAVLPGELAAVDRGAWAADAAPLMLSFTHEESGAALSVPTFRPGHNDKPFRGIYN